MSESNENNKNTPSAAKKKAVALRYRLEEDMAPVVIAAGYGIIADKIIDIAEERGIPVFKDDSAASMLCMLEVGRNIPPELYEVIAAIYTQILSISSQIKHASDSKGPSGPNTTAQRLRSAAQQKQNKNETE